MGNYTTRDMAAVRTTWTRGDIIFASVYIAHDRECPPKELDSLVRYCKAKNLPLIIGTDCNAHHPAWGSTNINPRGNQLLEYVLASKLHVLNKGSSPTFVVANRSEVLDITLASNSILQYIVNWKVEDEESISDHKYITFMLMAGHTTSFFKRNVRKIEWDLFLTTFRDSMTPHKGSVRLQNVNQTQAAVDELHDALNSAINEAYPLQEVNGRLRFVPW